MGENNRSLSRFYAYVVDDGWNLPHEEIKEADLKVVKPGSKPYEEVCRQNRNHKGSWLTYEVARKYAAKSWIYRVQTGNRYVGKVREIGEELRELYGVTEIEARNILFERNVSDYVNKYERLKNLIPVGMGHDRYDDAMIGQGMAI